MSSATVDSPPPPSPRPSAEAQNALPPVQPPRKSVFRLIGEVLDHAGPGYLQFAITNLCNADCDFCGFAVRPRKPVSQRLAEAASLAAALALIVALCRVLGHLIGV